MTNVKATAWAPVVVGVDGSEQSMQALRWAARMAEVIGTRIHAVGAWEYPVAYGMAPPGDCNPGGDMEKIVTDTVDKALSADRTVEVTFIVREGGAAHVLLEESDRAQMLIVGSRGHGGFAGLLLGSVSAAVAEHATCPVLVVHGDQPLSEVGS